MRICFICNEYPPARHGGIGIFVANLARTLVEAGHQALVIGVYSGSSRIERERDQGVEVIRLPAIRLPKGSGLINRLWLAGWVTALYLRKRFQVLEVPDYQGWAWAIPPLIPTVMRLHSTMQVMQLGKEKQHFSYEASSLRRAKKIIASSRFIGEKTKESFKWPDMNYSVIFHGVCFPEKISRRQESPNTVLFFGTLAPIKGLDKLIEAWPLVISQLPAARLLIAGKDIKDPPLFPQLYRRLPEDMRKTVHYLGSLPHAEMMRTIEHAAVVCLPSLFEALGLVVLESMSFGKAVIFSRLGPGPEIIRDGFDGLLVDPRNPPEMAQAILRLLNHPEERRLMGSRARQTIKSRFYLEAIMQKNLLIYESLCKEKVWSEKVG